jgi:hypothetical protein
MKSLTDIDYVKGLKGNLRASLDTETGKEVIKFLEQLCGWYDFSETDPNRILIAHGKRQVLATIKTLLELTPELIVAIAKEKG